MAEWDQFWQDSTAEASYIGATGTHSLFVEFWTDFFASLEQLSTDSRCIDVASGTGIIVQCARNHFGDRMPRFTALDLSGSAIDQLTERLPGVEGIVADAADIPFESGSFDVVTSQFGAEYAGKKGINETTRLVADNGYLALVLHCRPGAIHDECAISLRIADQIQTSRLFPLAKTMFSKGFEAARGGEFRVYEKAVRKFRPAFRVLERALEKYGAGVASGFVASLKNDLEQINSRLQNYDPAEVMAWLDRLSAEALSYRARMKSMTDAAFSRTQIDRLCKSLAEDGFSVDEPGALGVPGESDKLAWVVRARRTQSTS